VNYPWPGKVKKYELTVRILGKNKMETDRKCTGHIEERDNNIYRLYFEANPILKTGKWVWWRQQITNPLKVSINSEILSPLPKRLDIIQKQNGNQSKILG